MSRIVRYSNGLFLLQKLVKPGRAFGSANSSNGTEIDWRCPFEAPPIEHPEVLRGIYPPEIHAYTGIRYSQCEARYPFDLCVSRTLKKENFTCDRGRGSFAPGTRQRQLAVH